MIDTNVYKATLEAELKIVTAELTTLGLQNPDSSSDWIPMAEDSNTTDADENVMADKYEDLENRTAIVNDLEVRYNNIIRAISKIEEGTYGICEQCGEGIEEARLDANPAARTCIAHRENEAELEN